MDVLVPQSWVDQDNETHKIITSNLSRIGLIPRFIAFHKKNPENSVEPNAELILVFWKISERVDELVKAYMPIMQMSQRLVFINVYQPMIKNTLHLHKKKLLELAAGKQANWLFLEQKRELGKKGHYDMNDAFMQELERQVDAVTQTH